MISPRMQQGRLSIGAVHCTKGPVADLIWQVLGGLVRHALSLSLYSISYAICRDASYAQGSQRRQVFQAV